MQTENSNEIYMVNSNETPIAISRRSDVFMTIVKCNGNVQIHNDTATKHPIREIVVDEKSITPDNSQECVAAVGISVDTYNRK